MLDDPEDKEEGKGKDSDPLYTSEGGWEDPGEGRYFEND